MMSQRISPNDGDQPIILSESRGEKHNLNQISNVKQTVKLSRDLSKSHSSVGRQIQEELEQDRIDSTGRFTLSNILARLFSPSTHWERTKRIDELLIQKETEQHCDPRSIFNCIKNDDLASLQERLKSLSDCDRIKALHERDAVGATIVHVAYLLEKYRIGHWLVETFPQEALLAYSEDQYGVPLDSDIPVASDEAGMLDWLTESLEEDKITIPSDLMPYTGENILHMTIIRRNLEETRWILDFYLDHKHSVPRGLETLLKANARGKFFDIKGDNYFGGYPLHFAVCSNDKQMFDLLLTYASSTKDNDDAKHVSLLSTKEHMSASARAGSRFRRVSNAPVPGAVGSSERGTSSYESVPEKIGGSGSGGSSKKRDSTHFTYGHNMLGPNVIFMCDNEGNNALHLCVLHQLQDMFAHVKKTAQNIITRELKIAFTRAKRYGKSQATLKPVLPPTDTVHLTPLAPFRKVNAYTRRGVRSNYHIFIPEGEHINQEHFDVWLHVHVKRLLEDRLLLVLNSNFHSPLTLAAANLGGVQGTVLDPLTEELESAKKDMLAFLLNEMKDVRWRYGPVKCSLMMLEGLELPYNENDYPDLKEEFTLEKAARRKNSALTVTFNFIKKWDIRKATHRSRKMYGVVEWICKANSTRAVQLPDIKSLIESKWQRVGAREIGEAFVLHVVISILFTIISIFPYHCPTITHFASGDRGARIVTIVYPLLAFILIIQFSTYIDDIFRYGWDYWGFSGGGVRGAAKLEKVMKSGITLAFFSVCICKIITAKHKDAFKASAWTSDQYVAEIDKVSNFFMSIGVLMTWFYFFYFAMGTESAPFALIIYRIVEKDLPFWMQTYGIVLLMFACALATLTHHDSDEPYYGIKHLAESVWELFQHTFSAEQATNTIDMGNVPPNQQAWFVVLYTSFSFVVNMLMLNLLIGLITNTYTVYTDSREGLVLLEKYNILAAMERPLSRKQLKKRREKYAISIATENYDDEDDDFQGDAAASTNSINKKTLASSFSFLQSSAASSTQSQRYHDADSSRSLGASVEDIPTSPTKRLEEEAQLRELQRKRRRAQNGVIVHAFENQETDASWYQSRVEEEMRAYNLRAKKVALLIIDPQIDYHSESVGYGGAVVSGVHHRLEENPDKITHIDLLYDDGARELMLDISVEAVTINSDGAPATLNSVVFTTPSKPVYASSSKPFYESSSKSFYGSPSKSFYAHASASTATLTPAPGNFYVGARVTQQSRQNRLSHPGGAMAIPGANEDSVRLAAMIRANKGDIDDIIVTLDSHHVCHITHATFWTNRAGKNPDEYSRISLLDVEQGNWSPVNPTMLPWCKFYLRTLQNGGNFNLTIWPEHCIFGSQGHCVVPVLNEALQEWVEYSGKSVCYVTKGQNCRTEMFGVLQAEVEDPKDVRTSLNQDLLGLLKISDRLIVCGQPLSHAVNFTVRSILSYWDADTSAIMLLKNGSSSLPGYERAADKFISDMVKAGVTITTTESAFDDGTAAMVDRGEDELVTLTQLRSEMMGMFRKMLSKMDKVSSA